MNCAGILTILSAVALSQVKVTVVDSADGKPIVAAAVELYNSGGWLEFKDDTAEDGTFTVKRTVPTGHLSVNKQDYKPFTDPWPLKSLLVELTPERETSPRKMCTREQTYVISKLTEDGTLVYEQRVKTMAVPCPDETTSPALGVPLQPPPVGYRWQLLYVNRWYDHQRQMHASQPYYALVPEGKTCVPCHACP